MPKPNTASSRRTGRRRIAGERSARPAPPSAGEVTPVEAPAEPPTLEAPIVEAPIVGGETEGATAGSAGSAESAGSADSTDEPRGSGPRAPRRGGLRGSWTGPSNLVLAVLALVTAGVVAAAAYFAVPAWKDRAIEQAQQTAPSVAERAVASILSYDYTSLGRDEKAAASYMTPQYRKKYEHTFTLVKHSAPHLKAKVTARVLGSGIAEADPSHAHVLVFVDQTTKSTANSGRPQVALNRVMLDMVRQDGRWLVDGITSY